MFFWVSGAGVEVAVGLMLTLVLRPRGALHTIGWNRREEGVKEKERERERKMVKLFVERRLLAFHSYCTLYLLYLFSCNTRHRLKLQQEACSDHTAHQLEQKYVSLFL